MCQVRSNARDLISAAPRSRASPDCAACEGSADPAHAHHGRRAGALFEILGAPELIARELIIAVSVPAVSIQFQRGAPTPPEIHAVVVLLPDHEPHARLSHTDT